jgi:hypothetical protein
MEAKQGCPKRKLTGGCPCHYAFGCGFAREILALFPLRQGDSQIERRGADGVENFDLACGEPPRWRYFEADVTRADGMRRNQFEIVAANCFFIRPEMIYRKVLPAQVQIEGAVVGEFFAVI